MDFLEYVDHYYDHPMIIDVRRNDAFYASDASIERKNAWGEPEVVGKCLRAQYYRLTGIPTGVTESIGKRKMAYGDAIHEYEVERLKTVCKFVYDEVSFFDRENNVSGRVDCILADPQSKSDRPNLIGLELKTVGGYHNKALMKKGSVPENKLEHVLQVLTYAEFYKHPTSGYMTWNLIYFHRDTGEACCHVIIPTEDGTSVDGEMLPITFKDIKARWDTLKTYLSAEQLPPRDYEIKYSEEKLNLMAQRQQLTKKQAEDVRKGRYPDKGDWQCRYCDFCKECWE